MLLSSSSSSSSLTLTHPHPNHNPYSYIMCMCIVYIAIWRCHRWWILYIIYCSIYDFSHVQEETHKDHLIAFNLYGLSPVDKTFHQLAPTLCKIMCWCLVAYFHRWGSVPHSKKLRDFEIVLASTHQTVCLSQWCLVPLLSVVSTLLTFKEATWYVIN